eukprot:173588-Chlamydomonas_euryale.AAC.1
MAAPSGSTSSSHARLRMRHTCMPPHPHTSAHTRAPATPHPHMLTAAPLSSSAVERSAPHAHERRAATPRSTPVDGRASGQQRCHEVRPPGTSDDMKCRKAVGGAESVGARASTQCGKYVVDAACGVRVGRPGLQCGGERGAFAPQMGFAC